MLSTGSREPPPSSSSSIRPTVLLCCQMPSVLRGWGRRSPFCLDHMSSKGFCFMEGAGALLSSFLKLAEGGLPSLSVTATTHTGNGGGGDQWGSQMLARFLGGKAAAAQLPTGVSARPVSPPPTHQKVLTKSK